MGAQVNAAVVKQLMQRGGADKATLAAFDQMLNNVGNIHAQNQHLQGRLSALEQYVTPKNESGPAPTAKFLDMVRQQEGGTALVPLFEDLISAVKQEMAGYTDARVGAVEQPVRGLSAGLTVRELRAGLVDKYGSGVAKLLDPVLPQLQSHIASNGMVNVEQMLWDQHPDEMADMRTKKSGSKRTPMEGFAGLTSDQPLSELSSGEPMVGKSKVEVSDQQIAEEALRAVMAGGLSDSGGHNDGSI